MNKSTFWKIILLTTCFAVSQSSFAFNFYKSTPVGSWQVREQTNTDQKGHQMVSTIRTSIVGEEKRNGKDYYWIEVQMDTAKIKNGERKKVGDTNILKTLVAKDVFSQDPTNVVNNLRNYADEIVMQMGDRDPMLITGGGAFADAMMKSMGTEMKFDYHMEGTKSVKVPAGTFTCTVMKGHGKTETKVVFKKFTVETDSDACVSDQVPFGIVSSHADIVTNGKASTSDDRLLEYGKAGAVSKITKTPVQGPSFPAFK